VHLVTVAVGLDQAAAAAIAIESLQRSLSTRESEAAGLLSRLERVEHALGLVDAVSMR
jgi:hypothetical protein